MGTKEWFYSTYSLFYITVYGWMTYLDMSLFSLIFHFYLNS